MTLVPVTTTHRLRRTAALAAAALLLTACGATDDAQEATPTVGPDAAQERQSEAFTTLEDDFDASLGVHVLDTGSGRSVENRADERFAYGSSGKALLAAALLATTEPAALDRTVRWGAGAVVENSPFTESRVGVGATLGQVAEAMVRQSDNTAFNVVLRELGGNAAFAAALREVGDDTTRPARRETALNGATPGDERDTTTPRAMAATLRAYLLDGGLDPDDAALLLDWMSGNATGDSLVRAGVPSDWVVADKSGAAAYGTRNDVAVVRPPGRDPLVVVVMSSRDTADAARDDRLVARATRTALRLLGD